VKSRNYELAPSLYIFLQSPNDVKKIGETYIPVLGQMGNAYKILVGKNSGGVYLGKHRRRWEDSFKMNLK
jgi:hypothetical protein